ncbi:unnamed protein product [Closterium sp. NIES-54]
MVVAVVAGVAVVAAVVVAIGVELFRGETCRKFHTHHCCFSRLDDAWRAEFGDEAERPRWLELLRSGVDNFALDYDAILAAMYALTVCAEGDCFLCVPPDPCIEAAAQGASESALPGTAPAESLHTFTLDPGAARLAVHNHLPLAERAHFGQHKTAKAMYDAVVARYSSLATALLGRLMFKSVDLGDLGAGDGGAGDGGAGAGGAGAGGVGAGGAGAGGTVQRRPFFVPPPPSSLPPPGSVLRQPDSPLPAPSPYAEQTDSLTERREPESRPASPVHTVRTGRHVPRPCPPPVPGTHIMALRPSSVPQRAPLSSPPTSSLAHRPDPESDLARAASPTVTRLLAIVVTDPSFESTAASALIAKLVDFPTASRLDYVASLVAEFGSDCPPSVGGECALGTDVLEDRQEDFECLAAAVPHLMAMLLALEGDRDAPDIPTPRSYAEAITGPYSSQWQTAMDAEMASWKSTCTYVDAVPPPGANIVDGMWIFRVKRSPGSLPVLKARYVARGFSHR